MKITEKECCGCALCAAVCPLNCISMQPDANGFLYPEVDESKCVNCNKCKNSCPVNACAEKAAAPDNEKHCFYAISANKERVAKASSGGAFPALAENVLKRGGAVVGAAFNQKFDVELKLIEDLACLPDLMQAKYVQAAVPPGLYKQALEILQAQRPLLFSGTPCQVAAFRSFCGEKSYPELLCAEIICHGVPSPAVWQSYLAHVSEKNQSPVKAVFFRDKAIDWHKYALKIDCQDRQFIQCSKESPYMQLFLQELISRKSCSHCECKGGRSNADLSMGDFWKLHKIAPKMNNSTGVSMAIVHNAKGMKALQECSWETLQEFPMDCVKLSNIAYYESIAPNPRRNEYLAKFRDGNCQWFEPDAFLKKKRKGNFLKRLFAKLKSRTT